MSAVYAPPFRPATAEELLTELRGVLDPNYLATCGDPASGGKELLAALCAMFARVQLALERRRKDGILSLAASPAQANVTLTLSRTNTAGALVLSPGSEFATSEGVRFPLTQRVQFNDGAATPTPSTVDCIALLPGYDGNIPANSAITLTSWVAEAGEPGTEALAASVVVTNATAGSGGAPDAIGIIAQGRGAYPRPGEDPEALRQRARRIADVVSPVALLATARRILLPYGIASGDVFYWDGWDIGPAADEDCSDDPSDDIRQFTPERGEGWFYVEVPLVPSLDLGAFSDADAADDCCSDGYPVQQVAAWGSLVQALTAAKGGGTAFSVVVRED